MTMAICLKCGDRKIGALTRCATCRFEPTEAKDQAKSILLSDHNMSLSDLETTSEMLKRGEPIGFDNKSVKELCDAMSLSNPNYLFGVRKTSWIMFGIAILVGTLLGSCFVTFFKFLGV